MQLLDLKSTDLSSIQKELEAKVLKAPAFFNQSPIVFGFEQLSDTDQGKVNLRNLCDLCRQLGLIPIAIRGGNAQLQGACKALGIAILAKSRTKPTEIEPTPAEPVATPTPQENSSPTKVVSSPIRSGQQIYAPGGDLIILSSVSAGAEVLADGNIHVYGALRGRALAGVQGDERARIFCTSQEAELVSVAGQFLVDENLRSTRWKEAVQIYLTDGQLTIDSLS